MRTLNQTITPFLQQGIRPRIFVRVFDSSDNDILIQGTKAIGDYEDRITTFGSINQSIRPEGGMAEVSGAEINRLVLDERMTLCTEASIDPQLEAGYRGAGRILASAAIYAGEYFGARDALSGNFSNIAIVCGRLRMGSGPYTFTVYRGFMQFTIPDDLTTLEDAYLSLPGQGLFRSQNGFLGGIPLNPHFAMHLVEGNWTTFTDQGALYNDFVGWETSGDYTLTDFNEAWTTAEYDTTNYIRLNQAGRDYILSKAGDIARFMLVSEIDANYSEYPTPPSGAQVVQFDAYNAKLKLRYNSKTLDNQNIEILYGLETLPATISGDTLDRVWTGVVDDWKLNDKELTLIAKQNDHKKNPMIPNEIFTIDDYPLIHNENIGKTKPILYGDFLPSPINKNGLAYIANEGNTDILYGYKDYAKAYIYEKSRYDIIKAQIAKHEIKELDNITATYETGINAFVMIAGDLTDEGTDKKQIAITSDTDSVFPYVNVENSANPLVCFTNFGYYKDSGTVLNPSYCIDEDITNYTEIGQSSAEIYMCATYLPIPVVANYGVSNLYKLAYIAIKTETDNYGAGFDLTVYSYTDNVEYFPYPALSIKSDGWHYLNISRDEISGDSNMNYVIKLSCPAGVGVKVYSLVFIYGYGKNLETELYLACKGRPDDGLGTVTGTASALIENPSHILESIARDEINLAATEIDTDALDTAATDVTGMKLAFQLLDRKGARELLDGIAAQSRLLLWWDEQDRLTCKKVDSTDWFPHSETDVPGDLDIFTTTGDPVSGAFTHHPIISGPEVRLMEMADVKNDFVVKYKKNYATGDYGAVLTCNKDAETLDDTILTALGTTAATLTGLCTACYNRLDKAIQTLEVEAWAIRDETTATALMVHLINWFSKRRYIIEFTAGITAIEWELGDFINVRDDRIEDLFGIAVMNRKKWEIISLNPQLNDSTYRIEAIEVE